MDQIDPNWSIVSWVAHSCKLMKSNEIMFLCTLELFLQDLQFFLPCFSSILSNWRMKKEHRNKYNENQEKIMKTYISRYRWGNYVRSSGHWPCRWSYSRDSHVISLFPSAQFTLSTSGHLRLGRTWVTWAILEGSTNVWAKNQAHSAHSLWWVAV